MIGADVEALLVEQLVSDPTATPQELIALVLQNDPLLEVTAVERLVERVVDRARGYGVIGALLDEPGVNEVMINGAGPVFIERDGSVVATELSLTEADLAVLIERILRPLGLRVDRLSPCVDARLPDGSRVNIVVPPVAIDGPVVTIRRFDRRSRGLERFGPPAAVEILRRLVRGRATMLVVGGTGAGKTSLLNALAAHIDPSHRVITIEDTAELALPGAHVVRLESRPNNGEGVGAIEIRHLVRNALRMRPDRLIIGEVRGGEALDLLLALNTGHEGSLTTCHANGPAAGLRRLETLSLLGGVDVPPAAIRDQLIGAIDIVVHVVRNGQARSIGAVTEVGLDALDVHELWPVLSRAPQRPTVRRALEGGRRTWLCR